MAFVTRWLLVVLVCGASLARMAAQCPDRPASGSEVQDPFAINAQNGVLQASLSLGHSVDSAGFPHYCYQYSSPGGVVEAPTLRLNPGDRLQLSLTNVIQDANASKMQMQHAAGEEVCGDGGEITVSSTNVHFHGMPIPPTCHQDDVINTLIQPGSAPFDFNIPVPADTPPGLYWYHPHVHGFTEFQVNGGAAGAIIVEGMDKVRPEVKGLTERVFVIRQQYLVPWIPGPYKLTINYQVANFPHDPSPLITMKPGERQFWRVVNATLQDFMPLEVWIGNNQETLQLIALDGYPLPQPQHLQTILVPPAGRAEFIVQAPPTGGFGKFLTGAYSTGPTGNADLAQLLATIQVSGGSVHVQPAKPEPVVAEKSTQTPAGKMRWSDLDSKRVTAERITTHVGAIEDWTIENHALETHAFHMHQIHFKLLEVDGQPVPHHDLIDTVAIPFWEGKGPYHSVKVRMDFSDPNIAGTFLFHCHILLHEDLGMMHKILVLP